MNKVGLVSPPLAGRNDLKKTLSWQDNPSVQELLNVISEIIANEYIEIAKKNKDVFAQRNS